MKLVWLREDLRLSDNPALYHAAESDSIACIYIITPMMFEKHDVSPNKINFLMTRLERLQKKLEALNIALNIVTVEDPKLIKKALLDYAQTIEANALFFNQQYEANERKRDQAVSDYFKKFKIPVKSFHDQCLFEPGKILTLSG